MSDDLFSDTQRVCFTVPGVPVAKARARAMILKRCLKCNRKTVQKECRCGNQGEWEILTTLEHSDSDTVRYESHVRLFAQMALNQAKISSPLEGPLTVSIRLYFPIPQSRAKKLTEGMPYSQRPDIDNCIKSIFDGINEVVWRDDSQVTSLAIQKLWADNPRAEVEVITQC